jgi:hypothetical protein
MPALLAIGLAACSTREAKMSPEVHAAFVRETEQPMPRASLQSSDGLVRAEVEAASPPTVERDGREPEDPTAYRVEIPIGDTDPIRCSLTGQSYAIGSAAAKMLSGKLIDASIQQRIAGLDAGAVGDRPYLYAQVVGTAHSDGEAALYQAKFFFAPLRFGAIHCVHLGLGYATTVRRVLSGLLGSLEFAPQADEAPPAYHEVTLTRLGPLTCGFNETRFYQRSDGGWGAVLRSVLVAPQSPSEAVGMDQLRVTSADANGVVERAASDSLADGQRIFSLELERAPLGFEYAVSGELQGKPVDDTLAARAPLRDDVSLARQIAAGTNGGSWSMPQWMPELLPLQPVDVKVTCPPRDARDDVTCDVNAGTLHFQAEIDRNGMTRSATVDTGKVEMKIERVFARGTF